MQIERSIEREQSHQFHENYVLLLFANLETACKIVSNDIELLSAIDGVPNIWLECD